MTAKVTVSKRGRITAIAFACLLVLGFAVSRALGVFKRKPSVADHMS